MRGDPELYKYLEKLNVHFDYYEHPPAPTIEDALKNWEGIDSTHCKNLFFRNHKGNRHYLVVMEHSHQLNIKDLEKRLKQGKISLASDKRLYRYLNLPPGSVSPFGLIHDTENHVHLFLDKYLINCERLSFHPNLNTASLVVPREDFEKYLESVGNTYEYIELYDNSNQPA